jgi:hypothetical protein
MTRDVPAQVSGAGTFEASYGCHHSNFARPGPASGRRVRPAQAGCPGGRILIDFIFE